MSESFSIDLSQSVTWTLVIIGWLIVNVQHNKREERKEIRISIDNIKKELQDLRSKSVSYHHHNNHRERLSQQILIKISTLSHEVRTTRLLTGKEYRKAIIAIRKSITLKNFDKTLHKGLNTDDEIINTINYSIDELIILLDTKFLEIYRTSIKEKILEKIKF